jgi:hypothetical protein
LRRRAIALLSFLAASLRLRGSPENLITSQAPDAQRCGRQSTPGAGAARGCGC